MSILASEIDPFMVSLMLDGVSSARGRRIIFEEIVFLRVSVRKVGMVALLVLKAEPEWKHAGVPSMSASTMHMDILAMSMEVYSV